MLQRQDARRLKSQSYHVNYSCMRDLSMWGACVKPLEPFYSHDRSRPPSNSPAVRNLKQKNDWAFLVAVSALVLICVLILVVAVYGR
jgi:hypothetical protein